MADEEKFYRKFRKRILAWAETEEGRNHKWAEILMAGPDLFYLLWCLTLDSDVPPAHKLKLIGALAYFISPIDLLPEAFLGPIGYLDDIALAAYVLNELVNQSDPELIRRHWAGDGDALDLIRKILGAADQMVGGGLWDRIKKHL
ncbi:MAG: YkvA family protein [Desulfococcaceae bacterium]